MWDLLSTLTPTQLIWLYLQYNPDADKNNNMPFHQEKQEHIETASRVDVSFMFDKSIYIYTILIHVHLLLKNWSSLFLIEIYFYMQNRYVIFIGFQVIKFILVSLGLVGNVGNILAAFHPDTPLSHNLGDIWNVKSRVGPYCHALCHGAVLIDD